MNRLLRMAAVLIWTGACVTAAQASALREGHAFGGIQAHEQLSLESARALVQWIVQGAR